MRDNPKSRYVSEKDPDFESILQREFARLDQINNMERDELATWFLAMKPAEQRRILHNMSEALKIVDERENIERVTQLLEALKTIAGIIGTDWAMAIYHFRQGMLDMRKGQLEAAVPHYEKAANNIEDPSERVAALYNLALILFKTGDLAKAENEFQKTLEIAREHSFSLGMGYCYLSLAQIALEKNNVPKAIDWLEKAQQCAEKANNPDLITRIINEQGIVYARSENLLLAREYYQQQEAYLMKQSSDISENLLKRARSSLMLNKARLAMRERRLEEAYQFAEEALKDQSSLTGSEEIENLALASMIIFNSSKIGKLPLITQNLLTAFRLAQKINYTSGLLMVGQLLALIYSLRGYFEPAYRVCAVAIDALERSRSQVGDEVDRIQYIQDKVGIYDRMVLLCLILTQLRRLPRYQHQALSYTERAKSRTFIELLGRTTSIAPPPNLPPELLQKETQVLDHLRALEISMRTLIDVKEQEQMERAYNAAQIELDEIWKQIASIAPEYSALRRGQPVTFDSVRELLRV